MVCAGNNMSLNVREAQCACWGDWNKATRHGSKGQSRRGLRDMMRSVDFIPVNEGSVGGTEAGPRP